MKKFIKVTHRLFNESTARFEFVHAGVFPSFASAVRHFGGEQNWFDKRWHRFVARGDLYTMQATVEGDTSPSRELLWQEVKPLKIESTKKFVI